MIELKDRARHNGSLPHHRSRWWLYSTIGLVIVVSFLTVFTIRYDPLVQGSIFGPTGTILYQDGQTTSFQVSVRNDGPIGVTVLGTVMTDRSKSYSLVAITGQYPPNSFSLAPHSERLLTIKILLSNCRFYDPGSYVLVPSVDIRYRVLGIVKTYSLPLVEPLKVVSPPRSECP